MKLRTAISRQIKRKLITLVCISASFAAFATLGDGGNKGGAKSSQKSLLSVKTTNYNFKTFSLKSGYNFRGNNVLGNNSQGRYILLNTVVTYQKGNNTYILPLKKKVLLDKINFNTTR
jgi:hypothetical protein